MSTSLLQELTRLVAQLDREVYDDRVDEHLVLLLHYLIQEHHSNARWAAKVKAVKSSTRTEIFKRLCIAKDFLHAYYWDKPDLNVISEAACLSVPQLVRQFKTVFNTTPHQYLIRIRLQQAAELLKGR